jgi:hypothetical protein
MMKTLIAIALVATAGFALAPAAEARPLPCDPPTVTDDYVMVQCADLHFCAVVSLDQQPRWCLPA